MFARIRKVFLKCYNNHVLRYIFFGGLTTLVNLFVYYFLRLAFHMNINVANMISVITAILFAYFTNSRFVFESKARNFLERFSEFLKFISARTVSMAVELGGVWLMTGPLQIKDHIAKLAIQFIVLVLNYVFSRLLVFTR